MNYYYGHIIKFWDKIFSIFIKQININNPTLPNFLYNRFSKFILILKNNDVLSIRNNQECRNLIAEVTFLLCNSLKTKSLSFIKIKENDLNLNLLQTKFTSDKNYVEDKVKYGDPKENYNYFE